MSEILSERFVKRAAIAWLSRQGYSRNLKEREAGEHGVDIKVRHKKYPRYYLVEVKGDPDPKKVKYLSSRREVSFVYAVGQIFLRMKHKANYKYGIAFPEGYASKVFKRLPWVLCKKCRLNVLLVNKDGKVKNFTWKELKHQKRER